MVPLENAESYLIFPSWANYTFAWKDLPHVFPFPEKYAMAAGSIPLSMPGCWPVEINKYAEMGYSVSQVDQQFIDGPAGGGLIRVRRDMGRWFPRILMIPQCCFEKPPGFYRFVDYGVYILVPMLRASHKLGETPMPLAPSPVFSVERLGGDGFQCFIALDFGRRKMATSPKPLPIFPGLKMDIEPISEKPEPAWEAFGKIEDKERNYTWYKISYSGEEIRLLIAALVYIGLELSARASGSLRTVHVFCSKFLAGIDYPSAVKWTQNVRRIRDASDW